jgi:CRISPR/Cas system type I-B associated protein Csh2 (Cas7 group RAMP superfamily)
MNPELLLSDKFVEFSSKVATLHEKKKQLNIEFKKSFEAHKAQIKLIEDEAANLAVEFQNGQKG